jgi:threonine synthase
MTEINCTNCRRSYPPTGAPFRCPTCGGIFDYAAFPEFSLNQVDENLPGIWPYQSTFGLPAGAPLVTLGEGATPLVWAQAFDRQVAFKLESLNPSGSYKDRGSAVLLSFLLARGVHAAVEDSSGNAGASFAAYASRAGVQAKVFIPDAAAGPKRQQIEAYGAQVVRIMGPRSNAAEAVLRAAAQGEVYASHAYMPFGLSGYATIAYELYRQLGQAPGAVIAPVGQGNLWLAIGRGFENLLKAGLIDQVPRLIGVQALTCAPIWAIHHYGPGALGWVTEAETVAEGVRIKTPLRGDAVLQFANQYQGSFIAVDEEKILPARDQLARLGFYVEPTSALVWQALSEVIGEVPDPIVVVLTGHGLKHLDR